MLIHLLLTLVILTLIFGLIWWIITLITLPPPFALVIRVVMAVIAVIIVINLLWPLAGISGCSNRLIC